MSIIHSKGRWAARAVGARIPVLVVAAGLVISILLVAALLAQAVGNERQARNQARLTNEILRTLQGAMLAGVDAETGQRGYLLTNDISYLEPYVAGAREWTAALDRLDTLFEPIATPEQAEHAARLRALADAKLVDLARIVDLAQAGDVAGAVAALNTDEGKAIMDEYREATAALVIQENAILDRALRRAESIDGRNLPLILVLLLATLYLASLVFWLERRGAATALAARDAEAMRRARDQADLQSRELNHRVKNLFAVITAMIRLAGRGAADTTTVLRALGDRVHALSVAHAVTLGELERPVASLDALLRATLAPHDPDGDRVKITGDTILIEAKTVTPLGLILHELATNAVKYGALSNDAGRLDIAWTAEAAPEVETSVRLVWRESGVPDLTPPEHDGFGSTMMAVSARQLEGTLERKWRDDGVEIIMMFPASGAATP